MLENFTEGPIFLSPWEKSPEWENNQCDLVDRLSPVVCVTYEQEQEVLQEEKEGQRHAETDGGGEEEGSDGGIDSDVSNATETSPPYGPRAAAASATASSCQRVQSLHEMMSLKLIEAIESNDQHSIDVEEVSDDDDHRTDSGLPHSGTINAHIEYCKRSENDVDIDDEILEFSQSVHDDDIVPQFFNKKSKTFDSRANGKGPEKYKSSNVKQNTNQLALSVVPRQSGSQIYRKRHLSGNTSTFNNSCSDCNSSHWSQRSKAEGREASSEWLSPRLMPPPVLPHPPAPVGHPICAASGSGTSGAHPFASRNIRRHSSDSSSSDSSTHNKTLLTGLEWSEGCFRKVNISSVNKEYSKKKRSRQTQLTLQSQRRRL